MWTRIFPTRSLFQLVDEYTVDGAEDSWARTLHGRSIRWYPAIAALLVIPVGMVRLIKYLVPFSVVANACLVTGVSVVFYFIFVGDDRPSALAPEERAKMLVWPMTRWSLFAGSTLCSMESIGMVCNYTYLLPGEFSSYILHCFFFHYEWRSVCDPKKKYPGISRSVHELIITTRWNGCEKLTKSFHSAERNEIFDFFPQWNLYCFDL